MKSPPTKGGVHKLMILLRDLLKDKLQNIFGEEMGGLCILHRKSFQDYFGTL